MFDDLSKSNSQASFSSRKMKIKSDSPKRVENEQKFNAIAYSPVGHMTENMFRPELSSKVALGSLHTK